MSDIDNINEAALTVRRTFYAILVYSAFCLVVLGLDFAAFNDFTSKINLPLINVQVDRATFMVLGPLVLIALVAYLHVFLGYYLQVPIEVRRKGVPTLFNIDNPIAETISVLVFYGIPLLVLAHFALAGLIQTASPAGESSTLGRWFPSIAFLAVLVAMVVLYLRRAKRQLWTTKATLVAVPLMLAVFAYQIMVMPFNPLNPSAPTAPTEKLAASAPDKADETLPTTQAPAKPAPSSPKVSRPLNGAVIPPRQVESASRLTNGDSGSPPQAVAPRFAYAFYGIRSGGSWQERHFANRTTGKAIVAVPAEGDVVEAVGHVNARDGYIRYTWGSGWVNQPVLDVITPGTSLTVQEVKQVVPGFHWIKVDLPT